MWRVHGWFRIGKVQFHQTPIRHWTKNLDSNYECRIPMFVTFLQTPDIGAIAILVHIDIDQHTSSTRHPTNSLVTTREQEYSEYLRIFGDIWACLHLFRIIQTRAYLEIRGPFGPRLVYSFSTFSVQNSGCISPLRPLMARSRWEESATIQWRAAIGGAASKIPPLGQGRTHWKMGTSSEFHRMKTSWIPVDAMFYLW